MQQPEHVLSAHQADPDKIDKLFKQTDHMRYALSSRAAKRAMAQQHSGLIVATLFYEPSTRTRLSFESAAQRLGAGVISTENAGEFSSAAKGETLEDTIRTVDKYAEAIVLRHPEVGAAERAAAVSRVPIINAGDGIGEHPTQAYLDVRTIKEEVGRLQDLDIVMGGDLAHGRTARSLALLMSMYPDNRYTFVSTPQLQIGQDIKDHLTEVGASFTETDDMFSAVRHADVVYWGRLKKEYITDPTIRSEFTIGQTALQLMRPEARIMHPLPRVGEIEHSIDADPRAIYFDQVEHGLHVRAWRFSTMRCPRANRLHRFVVERIPEVPARDTLVGVPLVLLGTSSNFSRSWHMIEIVQITNCVSDAQITSC
jgi:aspartate carbamoyltransferase catalytic subunit